MKLPDPARLGHQPALADVTRAYTPADVVALQGSVVEEHTLARRGAEVLWAELHTRSGSTRSAP